MTIDLSGIPDRVVLDTSVLTLTRPSATGREADLCKEIWAELMKQRRRIIIPAIALAEYMHEPPHAQPKRDPLVEIGGFDEVAAIALATRIPHRVWQMAKDAGVTKKLAKFDAMIVATALRHRAGAIIGADDWLMKLGKEVGLVCKTPMDLETQMPLFASGGTS